MKKILSFVLMCLMAGVLNAENAYDVRSTLPVGEGNPYSQNPFTIPEALSQYSGYRTDFKKVSAIDFSALHWNHFVSIFTNTGKKVYRSNFLEYLNVIEAEEEDEDYEPQYQQYPEGTVLFKEHFISENGSPGAPTQLSIMIKHPKGYDEKGGNWEYVQLTKDGQIVVRGSSKDQVVDQMCAQCHMNVADKDYIFALNYKDTSMDE